MGKVGKPLEDGEGGEGEEDGEGREVISPLSPDLPHPHQRVHDHTPLPLLRWSTAVIVY